LPPFHARKRLKDELMTDTPDRRAFLKAAAATGALGAVGAPAA